jgi:hypothetical protein
MAKEKHFKLDSGYDVRITPRKVGGENGHEYAVYKGPFYSSKWVASSWVPGTVAAAKDDARFALAEFLKKVRQVDCACPKKNPKARKPKKPNPIGGARASYAKTHWGDMGNGEVSQGEALDITKEETLVTLGVLREIVYETVKGLEDAPAEYEHKFSKRNPPILAYGQKSGKLVIISPRHGGYFVSWRGIVG